MSSLCACGLPALSLHPGECAACHLDRAWKNSSEFALLFFTEPTAAFCAFLWHWLGLDSPELRCAFLGWFFGRPVSDSAELTDAERDAVRDWVNEQKGVSQ